MTSIGPVRPEAPRVQLQPAVAPAPAPDAASPAPKSPVDEAVSFESNDIAAALERARSPKSVELEQAYALAEDGGQNLEVAMAAVVFDDLQRAGLIPKDAQLATKLPPADGWKGTTYEARLVELITDQDKNGKLDLDLTRLRESGILAKPAGAEQLQKALNDGAPHDGLGDDFVKRQADGSKLTAYGQPNARGHEVESYSQNMTLSTDMDRAVRSAVVGFDKRAAKSPAAAKGVVDDALALASKLRAAGDGETASRLLDGTGAALVRSGRYEDARRVFDAIAASPNAGDRVNLARTVRDAEASYNKDDHLIGTRRDGTNTTVVEKGFASTWKAVAERRLAQVDLAERMTGVLGRTAELDSLADAREYFGKLSGSGTSTEAIGREYGDYLANTFVHSGADARWNEKVARAERGTKAPELMKNQARDAVGRTVIDCEGFAAITDHIFRGDRFTLMHAGKPGHVIAGAFDAKTGGGFIANNEKVSVVSDEVKTPLARQEALAKNISGGFYDVIAFGADPDSSAIMPDKKPRMGARIWLADHFGGSVDDEFMRRYNSPQGMGRSLSRFVGAVYAD